MKTITKHLPALVLTVGLAIAAGNVKAQDPPKPPPPPPSPKELFNKINPFKKNKDAAPTDKNKAGKIKPADTLHPAGPPPSPPNPMDLFKKKDKKTPV
jgi:hypothetical protein